MMSDHNQNELKPISDEAAEAAKTLTAMYPFSPFAEDQISRTALIIQSAITKALQRAEISVPDADIAAAMGASLEKEAVADHVNAVLQKALEEEQIRWQEGIEKLIRDAAPKAEIDGGGCESGDPLDFTLAEIGQAFAYWDNRAFDALQKMGLSAQGYPSALEALIDIFPNDSVDADVDGQREAIIRLRAQIRELTKKRDLSEHVTSSDSGSGSPQTLPVDRRDKGSGA